LATWLVAAHFSITDKNLTKCKPMDGGQERVFVNAVRRFAFLEDGELYDS
jgi:hypothetical protein